MNFRMPSPAAVKSAAKWGTLLGGGAMALVLYRAPAPVAPAPLPVVPVQLALPPVLENAAAMMAALHEARNTVTVQEGKPVLQSAAPEPKALKGPVGEWFRGMLADNLSRVTGCGDQQRAAAFVAMLAPGDARQHAFKTEMGRVVADMAPTFTTPRAVVEAYQDLLLALDAEPCRVAPPPQRLPQPEAQAGPGAIAAPVQSAAPAAVRAGAVAAPAQPEQPAAAPAEQQPAQQPVRAKRKDTPTRCLGFAALGCEGGLSEAPGQEEELPWASRS